jgi:hypothetical protein
MGGKYQGGRKSVGNNACSGRPSSVRCVDIKKLIDQHVRDSGKFFIDEIAISRIRKFKMRRTALTRGPLKVAVYVYSVI